ncbi:MAG: CPBP family intramembrane metalloprotease [Anaerolineae bacterium]|nr:CPBP family intramembrane metalloprotease [Anaerolineae bacterium]MCO5203797.1 CPBP family intramembrane metalloprotease [Anaerolineae bacterium]
MKTSPNQASAEKRRLDWPLITFFAIAYAIAWGIFLLLGRIAEQSGAPDTTSFLRQAESLQFTGLNLTVPGWLVYLLTRLQDWAFSIAGLIMIAYTAGRSGIRELGSRLIRWRFNWKWYALAVLPLGLYSIATIVAVSSSESGVSAEMSAATLRKMLFSAEAGLFVSLFLRGAFGEELGLRGFALPRMQLTMTPFRASVIIGALWGMWHLPVLLGRDPVSIVAFLLLSFGLSFIFTLLFNGSGGSLIPGLLFHATQNWEEGFELVFPVLLTTDWELVSTLLLLLVGIVAGVVVWRGSQRQSLTV